MLTPRIPRLTISCHGFLARTTALSWPWNRDRILATPGTLPPSFADLALGLADQTRPVIQVWCKDPLQRDASPVVPAQAGTQGATTQSAAEPEALDPRSRKDDGEVLVSAQNPLQRERGPQLPPAGGGEGRGEVGKPQPAEPHVSAATTSAQNPLHRERTGPLRNGNLRGNPNLAPRCGARTRRTGCPCRAPAMRNGRCRLHGGKSTGPRTEEGRARIRAARTRHGLYSAESRAFQRGITGLLRRNRELLALARQPGPVDEAALRHLMPADLGKNLLQREPGQNFLSDPPRDQWIGPERAGVTWGTHQPPEHTRSTIPQSAATAASHLSRGVMMKDPMQREATAARAQRAGQNPVQREEPRSPPARQATSVTASPTPPIRRPILLARPIPLAT